MEQKAITGIDGKYKIYVPNSDSEQYYQVEATPSNYHAQVKKYQNSQSTSVTLVKDATNSSVNLALTVVNVTGTIKTPVTHNADTNPLNNQGVPADLQLRTSDWSYNQWTTADTNGNFQFSVPTENFGSDFVLEIQEGWGDYYMYPRTVIEGLVVGEGITDLNEDAEATDGALRYGTVNVWGIVKDSDDTAIEDAWVNLGKQGQWYGANTDANGKFQFGGVPIGHYDDFEIQPPSGSSCASYRDSDGVDIVAGPNDLGTITLEAPNVTGNVYGPGTGTDGQNNVWVEIRTLDWSSSYGDGTGDDDSGAFGIGIVPDGDYKLSAHVDWNSYYKEPAETTVTISGGVVTKVGDDDIVDDTEPLITDNKIRVRLTDPAVTGFSGDVYGPTGEVPQPNIDMNLHQVNSWEYFWTQTSTEGKFAFGNVLDGSYELEARPWGGDFTQSTATVVVDGETITVNDVDYTRNTVVVRLSSPNILGTIKTPIFADGHTTSTNPYPNETVQTWVNLHQEGIMGPGNWYNSNTNDVGAFGIGGVEASADGTVYTLEIGAPWGGNYSVYSGKRYNNITFKDLSDPVDGIADECYKTVAGELVGDGIVNNVCNLDALLGTGSPKALRLSLPQIRGTIKAGGAGLRDCWVMVHDSMWMNQTGANTDENGHFNIGGLPHTGETGYPANGYDIEVNLPWGGENSQAYVQPSGLKVTINANDIGTISGGGSTNNIITLGEPSKTLTGYVKKDDASATPVQYARVEAFRNMGGGHFETTTEADGSYTLKLSGGAWRVEVRASWNESQPDWVYSKPPTLVTFAENTIPELIEDQDFEVSIANATVTGVVKSPAPNSQAVSNAWVDIHTGMMGGMWNGTNTNNSGQFTVKVPAGTYQVSVHPGYGSSYGSPASVQAKAIKDQTVDMGTIYLLDKNATITGTVTDDTGNPIGNVFVNAWQLDGMDWADTQTNASTGRFSLSVSPGQWQVMIMPMSTQYVYQGAPKTAIATANKSEELSAFVLKVANNTVRVKVSDYDNPTTRVTNIFGGVWMRDAGATSDFKGDMLDFGKPMDDMMGGMDSGGMMGMGMEKGGFGGGGLQNGYTELKVPTGKYEVGLGMPPGSKWTLDSTEEITIIGTETNQTTEVDLYVRLNDREVTGYFKDTDGNTITGINAFIHATRTGGGWADTDVQSDGSYTLLLCDGDWKIDAWIDPFMTYASTRYTVKTGSTNLTVSGNTTHHIVLQKLDLRIQGNVYEPDGITGMPNVWVFADFGDTAMIDEFKGPGGPGLGAFTGATGAYTLYVTAGSYKLGAGIPPWDPRHLISPDLTSAITVNSDNSPVTQNLTFKLADATITGTVSPTETDSPAFVRAWTDTGGYEGSSTSNGVYTLNVNSGEVWHLVASAEIGDIFFESAQANVTTIVGPKNQNLTLVSKAIRVPESKTVTFDAADAKTIILNDNDDTTEDLAIEIPAGAIAASGTITLKISPKIDVQPDSTTKPIGVAYDFEVKKTTVDDSGNRQTTEVSTFTSDVKITFPYDENLATDDGTYSENDITPKYWDTEYNVWKDYKEGGGGITRDTTNDTVTVTTKHFSSGGMTAGNYRTAGTGGTTPGGTTPGGGGAGGGVNVPTNGSISINAGAVNTSSRDITLTLTATGASHMALANDANFAGRSWEAFATSKSWTLTAGDEVKTVYVKFRASDGSTTGVYSDTITLSTGVAPEVEVPVAEVGAGDLIKVADSPAVYLIKDGKRHVIPHINVYKSWAYPADFSTVKTIAAADLASFPEAAAVPFRDGSLFRGTDTSLHGKEASCVFVVAEGKLRSIKSAEIYQALYNDPDWSLITWVPDDLLTKFEYALGSIVDSSVIHPNGSIVKYADSSAVYLIAHSQKRVFTSWVNFVANGYDAADIIVIPDSEFYADGAVISGLEELVTTPVFTAALSE